MGQLVQPPCVGLGGLYQVHLPARREEGAHLLEQRRPGSVQAGGKVLGLLGWKGFGGTPIPTPHSLPIPGIPGATLCMQSSV